MSEPARWRQVRAARLAAVVAACAGLGSAALGQVSEYRLDESGNWVQVKSPEPGSDEAVIDEARRALAQDRPADAKRMMTDFIDRQGRQQNPWLPEALLLRGDAYTAMGEEYEALYDYERVIKEYANSEEYVTAVSRELDIAVRYANGLRRPLLGIRLIDATDIAEELLIRVQERMPGSRLAERAGIELADYYYRDRDLAMAVLAYDLFIENYPNSQYLQKAMQRRIYATIGRFKGPKYDGSVLIDAKILTRRFTSLYPEKAKELGLDDGLITRLDESAGQEFLETARYYMAQDDPVSARFVLRRLLREHPRTAAAARALQIMTDKRWLKPGEPSAPEAPGSGPSAGAAGGVPGGDPGARAHGPNVDPGEVRQ